jgi:ABC-type microcin C transport system duplicated ATPase subunit YejF
MIFQEPMTALNPLYTIGDQIAEVLELHEGVSARDARGGRDRAAGRTGIPGAGKTRATDTRISCRAANASAR